MAKFKLTANYKPTGDQPSAIAKLTDGIAKGAKEQVLLGVTGSGKSVVGNSKVVVHSGQKAAYLDIKQLGNIFTSDLPKDVETTQVALLAEEVLTYAFDPATGTTGLYPVKEISRHRYTGQLYSVLTTDGRSNTFTDDHNLFVLRQGQLKLVKSHGLRVGDYVPVPDNLVTPSQAKLDWLDLREWLPEDDFYVATALPAAIPVATPGYNSWATANRGQRVHWSVYKTAGLTTLQAQQDKVSLRSRRATLPVIVAATPELMRFLGIYIAEGHAAASFVVLSTGDQEIVKQISLAADQLSVELRKATGPYDYKLGGTTISQLMKVWCGGSSRHKHLPAFWPQCSDRQLAELLSGYFAGDGWVEKNAVCAVSVSQQLISDLQFALMRFGIAARVRSRNVKYAGQIKVVWQVSITGRDNLRRYQQHVGFGLQRKDDALANILSQAKVPNTNKDIFPLNGSYIRRICRELGLSRRVIARALPCSEALISLYWNGSRLPSRHRARRMLEFIYQQAIEQGQFEIIDDIGRLLGLTRLQWSPIEQIATEAVDNEIVYDLSVPATETFLSGSGGYYVHNTFTMANVIQNQQRPTLVLSHNKTLAAQLYSEFKTFFPENAVHYFVSYFDYYQPEAYIPRSDTYIEKDSQINEEIDRLRHAATDALLSRRDVIIVASVSCIYGIGSVEDYGEMSIRIEIGERRIRDKFLRHLTDIQYQRNDIDFHRGTFRVRGDVVDIFPAGEEVAYRVEFFGDEVERITKVDPLTGEILTTLNKLRIFPGSHYVTPQDKLKTALGQIERELEERLQQFKQNGQLLEAQRLEQRTRFDLEMLEETGFVKGIENYSRYLTNREPGEQPATLMDYFPDDYLMFIDESHMTIPQVRGMYNGDRARKEVLVEHGFRLPSALDNRPLTFTEFEKHINQVVYVSATPAQYELSRSPEPAQQVIRPTGLLDPPIEVRPIEGQIDDLISEIRDTVAKRQRVLVTTLTKRMSEDLTEYLQAINIKVTYLHSDVDTLDRTDILRDLRLGVYDVVVGINLLREGLDLPEVSLVAILDADKEGFLRSEQALIQTVGRAARHVEGRVIMYADSITGSMRRTIEETERRRAIQRTYNDQHGIIPTGIAKEIDKGLRPDLPEEAKKAKLDLKKIPRDEYGHLLKDLQLQMDMAAANLEFEKAAELRDIINDIKKQL